MDKYTAQDAINRVLTARTSSMPIEQVTSDYLIKLRIEVAKWLEQIDKFIFMYNGD